MRLYSTWIANYFKRILDCIVLCIFVQLHESNYSVVAELSDLVCAKGHRKCFLDSAFPFSALDPLRNSLNKISQHLRESFSSAHSARHKRKRR